MEYPLLSFGKNHEKFRNHREQDPKEEVQKEESPHTHVHEFPVKIGRTIHIPPEDRLLIDELPVPVCKRPISCSHPKYPVGREIRHGKLPFDPKYFFSLLKGVNFIVGS